MHGQEILDSRKKKLVSVGADHHFRVSQIDSRCPGQNGNADPYINKSKIHAVSCFRNRTPQHGGFLMVSL